MAGESDIDEIKRMCVVLFLELQEVRRRLDIEPFGLQDSKDDRLVIARDLRHFDEKLRHVAKQQAGAKE